MVKKSLIAITLLAVLVTIIPTQAVSGNGSQKPDDYQKFEDEWSAGQHEILELELGQFPVYLDIGPYIEIIDCSSIKIHLEQVPCGEIDRPIDDFPCFYGFVSFEMRGNFDVKVSTKFYNNGPVEIITDHSVSLSDTNIPGDGIIKEIKLYMKAWKLELFKYAPEEQVRVGEIAICITRMPKPKGG